MSSFHLLLPLLLVSAAAPAQTAPQPVDPAMCEQLANMPAAPMSVESCKSMLGLAVDDPASHRPGDEAMSCKQIFAEMQTRLPSGVSSEEAARREALVQQASTMNERHAKANAIESAPEARALQTASVMPGPLATPVVAATEASLKKKRAVATKRYLDEANQVTAGSASAIEQTFGDDPRRKRLGQLAAQKGCTGAEQ
jgi:hypothetical protein